MNAVIFERHGPPAVLRYRKVPPPTPQPGEAVIQVEACALNHLDLWVRQGLPGIPIPLPHISGCEIVGRIAAVGDGVKDWRLDQRVLVAPGSGCGGCDACRSAHESRCARYQIMGLQRQGGYAEYAVAETRRLIAVSGRCSPVQWAALPLVGLTAWHMLITRGALRAGETVLIHAAGSGIGSLAIQLAKLAGASVIATGGTPAKLRLAKRLGADAAINYRRRNFASVVRGLTGGRGVDLVFEHIGPATWERSLESLARGGRLVTCGATSGPRVTMDLRYCFARELSIIGCYMGSRYELDHVLRLAEAGRLTPVVDRVYPLREAAAAQRRMARRQQLGKLVLKP